MDNNEQGDSVAERVKVSLLTTSRIAGSRFNTHPGNVVASLNKALFEDNTKRRETGEIEKDKNRAKRRESKKRWLGLTQP